MQRSASFSWVHSPRFHRGFLSAEVNTSEELGGSRFVLLDTGEVHQHLWFNLDSCIVVPEASPLGMVVVFLDGGIGRLRLHYFWYGPGTRFHCTRLLAQPEVFKGPWPLRGSRGDGHGKRLLVGLALAWLHGAYSPLSARSVSLLTSIAVRARRQCDSGASGRRVSFNAQNERLPGGRYKSERTCQGLGACRDGSPSLPGCSWRLCTPSGVHGPRATCG